MAKIRPYILAGIVLAACLVAGGAIAADVSHSTPGLGGYDPVAYFTDGKPTRGSGYHVAVYDGVTYAFATAEHKKQFLADPTRYVPAYGGYCAYGVAIGKKFWADPAVWEIVDGTLYLNLDKPIQQEWNKDKPGYITKADSNWGSIKDKSPGDL